MATCSKEDYAPTPEELAAHLARLTIREPWEIGAPTGESWWQGHIVGDYTDSRGQICTLRMVQFADKSELTWHCGEQRGLNTTLTLVSHDGQTPLHGGFTPEEVIGQCEAHLAWCAAGCPGRHEAQE